MIRELTTDAALRASAPALARLWRESPGATIFTSPDWLCAWWSCFGTGRLRAWLDDDAASATAFAPFFVRDGWDRAPELALVGMGNADYLDALSAGAPYLTALIEAALERCAADGIARAEWARLRPDSHLASIRPPSEWGCRLEDDVPCVVLALPGSRESFDANLRGMVARNLRRGLETATRLGSVRFEHASGDGVADVLEQLFSLHGERWRARGLPGVLRAAEVQRFHHIVAREADRAGTLRLIRLAIGGETAGVLYGFTTPAGTCVYITGFNPALAACSPGTLLIRELIRRAIDEGARACDFLSGQEPYKYQWGADDRRVLTCRLRRHPRPFAGEETITRATLLKSSAPGPAARRPAMRP